MRVRIAASAPPMVIAGNTRLASDPDPDTGSHPSLMAKNRIRIGPSAKFGNDSPNKLTTLSNLSSHFPGRFAERTPAGVEIKIATGTAATLTARASASRSRIMVLPSLLHRYHSPSSPPD